MRGKAKNADLWFELLNLSKLHMVEMEWVPFRSKDPLTRAARLSASQASRSRSSQDYRRQQIGLRGSSAGFRKRE